MHSTATFYFHGCLNDFLPASNKNSWIQYWFNSSPSIKDAIEAIGIPHVEAHTFTVNGIQTDFNYHLKMEDSVEVYPLEENNITTYKDPDKMNLFVLDVHLGTLARVLRTLGFDSIYQNNYSDQVIVQIAEEENRIVLTRDVGLLKQKRIQRGYWLRSQHTDEQLR